MKTKLFFLGLMTAALSSAQINVNQGFENTTYPGFTNVSFFRSAVISPCVGTYGLSRNFWSGGTVGSTTYASTASNGGKLDIAFRYKTHIYNGGSVNGTMKIEYSVDGGTSYQAIQTINLTSVVSCTAFTTSLPQGTVPAGADFRFRVSGNWTSGDYYVILDDFQMTQSATLAVSDAVKKGINVYPNPFTDVIFLDNAANVKSISVADLSGRIWKVSNNVSGEVKLNELKTGTYILTVNYKDGQSSSSKIVKR